MAGVTEKGTKSGPPTPPRVFTIQLLGEGAPQEVTAFNVQFKDGWVLFFYDQHDEELVLAFPTARVVYVEGGGLA